MKQKKQIYSEIKTFLIEHADTIQKLATKHHKEFLGGKKYRSEVIKKYQKNHIRIVEELAKHLEQRDIKKGLAVFKNLAKILAQDSVKDGLYIEEAVNGIIFLKQALWEKVQEKGLLKNLTAEQLYYISQTIGIYIDVVASKIAFEYHTFYIRTMAEETKDRKVAEQDVKAERKFAEDIVETIREPLIILDRNLQVVSANNSFYTSFNVEKKVTEKKLIFELGSGQWNIPGLKILLQDVLPKKKQFNDFEVTHSFPSIGHKIMLLNARSINHMRLILLAIEDITARRNSERNFQFLAEASRILSSSLDYQTTHNNVAKLAVPEIADWCAIDILNEKGMQLVAVAHKDPKKIKWAKELRKVNPVDMNAPTGLPNVIRTGKSEIYPTITDELLVKASRSKKELQLLRSLGFTSAMIVPLYNEKKCVGGITFVTTETRKHYTQDDLIMAEELANRASIALENAGLYKASQDAITLSG